MTLAELQIGASAAVDLATRARRIRTLAKVESELDALIGATAAVHGLPLYTQDAAFDEMPGITVVRV